MNLKKQFIELASAPSKELEHRLKCGKMPNSWELVGHEYDGWNTLFPFNKGPKFRKGFKKENGGVTGYNLKMEADLGSSNPIEEPWRNVLDKDGKPIFFGGYFDIRPAMDEPTHNIYPNALLFDYNSIGKNPMGICGVMDYVVEINEGDPRLLLGEFHFTPSFNNVLGRFDSNKSLSPNYFLLLRKDCAGGQ